MRKFQWIFFALWVSLFYVSYYTQFSVTTEGEKRATWYKNYYSWEPGFAWVGTHKLSCVVGLPREKAALATTTATATTTAKKTIGLISKPTTFHVLPHFFYTFLCRPDWTTTRWKCLISRFMENANKERRTFSFSSWTWVQFPRNQLQGNSPIFHIFSELE